MVRAAECHNNKLLLLVLCDESSDSLYLNGNAYSMKAISEATSKIWYGWVKYTLIPFPK